MITFPNPSQERLIEAFDLVKDVIKESHRPLMMFDYLDDTFILWLRYNKKNGNALNYYKDQRGLLEWSTVSLTYAYNFLLSAPQEPADTWMWSDPSILSAEYYYDNTLYRLYAALERVYSFCDLWFELGLSKSSGNFRNKKRIFDEALIETHPEWSNSTILCQLRKLLTSESYSTCIERLRNPITHNLDPKKINIEYKNDLIKILDPSIKIDKTLVNQAKSLLGDIYQIRMLEANELARSLDWHGVRRITPIDQDYWCDEDSPLF